jgi:beta-glucosidase
LKAKHNEALAIVEQMTLEEKASFCSGNSFWYLEACERLGLPAIMVTDGPHGLRKQASSADGVGLNVSVPATCYPTASALASSWDPGLLREIGVALGEQCVAENVAVLLGPGMNIKRHPLCGRNFEYFSEDPLLSGELAAAMIQGVQSQGVGTSVKHFAVNNQEHGRMYVDAVVDERALREIYLRGFEIAVKKAQPWTVMCAYNRINGTYCSEHDWLLNRLLRDEWGFQGLVVTDWGATNDRVRGLAAGLDLEMPGNSGVNDRRVLAAVGSGELSEADLDRAVARNVGVILSGAELVDREIDLDQSAHHALAHRAAAQCAVLLKNENNVLPLVPSSSMAIIGAFAKRPRFQGAGSSQVKPTRRDSAFDAIASIVQECGGDLANLTYAAGYDPKHSEPDAQLLEEAVALARQAEVAVVFAGLPGIYESEGFDRAHLRLPEQHDQLIEAVCLANPNTVVVLANGAPVEMPWVHGPKSILEGYLGGQAGGAAVADLLLGRANPSGKLAETFPLKQADVPSDSWFPGSARQVQYREGLYVGYRYFDSAGIPVLFPFGHGLSYTQFEFSDLTLSEDAIAQGDGVLVNVDVTNTGAMAGSEVVQLYVHDVESSVYRPQQELKAFAKVALEPGATRRVTLELDDAAFAVYDTTAQSWVVEAGQFEIRVGASSRDIRLQCVMSVSSENQINASSATDTGPRLADGDIAVTDTVFAAMLGRAIPSPELVRPFHVNSSINEIAQTWLGGLVRTRVVAIYQSRLGSNVTDETLRKMFEEMANNMPLRALATLSGGQMSFKSLNVLIAVLNKRFFTALRLLLQRGDTTW